MKNSLYLDIDTDRELQPIMIGKGAEITQPQTSEEAAEMIKLDISCLCEAMCTLVHVADQSGYGSKADFVAGIRARLDDFLLEGTIPVENLPEEPKAPENSPEIL